jgi:sulfite reductase (NADPH) flavoprotein alpha-component
MDRFGMLPDKGEIKDNMSEISFTDSSFLMKENFELFQTLKLSNIQSVQFPFSLDKEDYFQLKLLEKDIIVNQFNGQILSSEPIDNTTLWEIFMYNLHTGKGSISWSLVLCFASLSILFFIFSGFKMTFKRLKGKKENPFKAKKSRIIILVGSQGGATFRFAKEFQKQLIQSGQKVFVDDLSSYEVYDRMEQLIIMTSTYGDGEAPTNSKEFLQRFGEIQQKKKFNHAIVGFGSTDYFKFCQFAKDVSFALEQSNQSKALLPLKLINKQSVSEFESWCLKWVDQMQITSKK